MRRDNERSSGPLAGLESGSASPAARTAVLLHGLGGSAADWAPQLEALEPQRPCLALDLRGHGSSPLLTRRASISDHAADVARAIEQRVAEPPVHLIGVSLGSMVALELAATRPDLARSACAISTFHDTRLRSLRSLRFFLSRWIPMRLAGPNRLARALGPRLFPNPDQADLRERFVTAWSTNDPDSYRRCFEGSFGWTLTGREARLDLPVLVLRGERDYFPEPELRKFVERLPNGRFVAVPGTGHALPVELPGATLAQLLPFLARHDGPSGKREN